MSALTVHNITASSNGDFIVFRVNISGYEAAENLSVQLHYIFDKDVTRNGRWRYVFMEYNASSDLWEIPVQKEGDAGTIYYYITVLYPGQQIRYPSEGYESYAYSPGAGINLQALCLIVFFIFFVIFELVMRYPLIKKRRSEEASVEESETEDSGEEIHEETVTKCPECGKIVAASSEKCPYCGFSQEDEESKEITMGSD